MILFGHPNRVEQEATMTSSHSNHPPTFFGMVLQAIMTSADLSTRALARVLTDYLKEHPTERLSGRASICHATIQLYLQGALPSDPHEFVATCRKAFRSKKLVTQQVWQALQFAAYIDSLIAFRRQHLSYLKNQNPGYSFPLTTAERRELEGYLDVEELDISSEEIQRRVVRQMLETSSE